MAKQGDDKSVKSLSHQDWSGHITMNAQLMRYYEELNARGRKLDAMHKHGMIERKETRNPLKAERTPRIDMRNYSYHPPPGQPVPEKWKYPENDWGIMSKFQSQKQIYDDIFNKDKEYKDKMAELNYIRAQNQEKIDAEVSRLKQKVFREKEAKEKEEQMKLNYALNPGYGSRDSSRRSNSHRSRDGSTARSTARSGTESVDELDLAMQAEQAAKEQGIIDKKKRSHKSSLHIDAHRITGLEDLDSKPKPKDISQLKVSTIRELNSSHPEVLAKWRAQRAAEFISTHKGAVDPPEPRRGPLHDTSFRPGGLSSIPGPEKPGSRGGGAGRAGVRRQQGGSGSNSGSGGGGGGGFAALATADMSTLKAELKKTEDEIANQNLKLKLNTKPARSFQKVGGGSGTAAASARDVKGNSTGGKGGKMTGTAAY